MLNLSDKQAQTMSRLDWKAADLDPVKIANYWIRKLSRYYGCRIDPDWASESLTVAYSRYVVWRKTHFPRKLAGKIGSMIRTACLSVVLESFRTAGNKPAETNRQMELWGVAVETSAADCDVDRLNRVLDRLRPDQQALCQLLIVESDHTWRAIRESLHCGDWTVNKLFHELRRHPAMLDLFLAHIVDVAAEDIDVDRLRKSICDTDWPVETAATGAQSRIPTNG